MHENRACVLSREYAGNTVKGASEMSSFRVLDAAVREEYSIWLSSWTSWPAREVVAHPNYVQLFARSCDRTLCAAMDSDKGSVLFPFILRPLSAEPWYITEEEVYDLSTPYGYGGAFAWGHPSPDEFWLNFDEWARANRIVSSFARLSLFPQQLIPFAGDVEIRAGNVIRTLDLDAESMWRDYQYKVRKNVNKAVRSGLKVEIDFTGATIGDFLAVYYATMERRRAMGFYYFPESFFHRIVRGLPGQFAFFHTLHEEKVVSTELVLISVDNVYSFLGGTLAEAFDLRPNDLLKHSIIEWAREQGKKNFVLGGGYNGRDGIFRYKLSFAPTGEVPFKVGKRTYDPERYEALVRMRREWETSHGRAWEPYPGFFPAYRG